MEPRETQEANSIEQLAAEMVELRNLTDIAETQVWHPEDCATSSWIGLAQIAGLQLKSADRCPAFRRVDAAFIACAFNHAADIARWAMKLKAELDEGVYLARQLEHDETEQTAYKLVQWAKGCGSSHTPQPIVDRLMEENAKLKDQLRHCIQVEPAIVRPVYPVVEEPEP